MKLTRILATLVLAASASLMGQAQAASELTVPEVSIKATITNEQGEVKTFSYKTPKDLPKFDDKGGVATFEVTLYANGRELDRYFMSGIQELATSVSWAQVAMPGQEGSSRRRTVEIYPSRVSQQGVLVQVHIAVDEDMKGIINMRTANVFLLTPEQPTYPMAWAVGDVAFVAVVRLAGVSAR